MDLRLSKSKYLSTLQCQKKLWLQIHYPAKATPPTPSQERIFQTGTDIGLLAQKQFPNGILITAPYYETTEALRETEAAISSGATVLFEPAFLHDNTFLRVDILTKLPDNTWNIIEVKSTTKVKKEHLPDLAVQRYVLEGSNLPINKTFLMHLNRSCTYPNLTNLFIIEDATSLIDHEYSLVMQNLEIFNRLILQSSEPNIKIGNYCSTPYECQFKQYCHQQISYPQFQPENKANNHHPTPKPELDWPFIREKLSSLTFPLHFLHFETDFPAIPRFNGMHPFDKLPFQYSCHLLDADNNFTNSEYLHTANTDPRLLLAESLTKDIGRTGTIIAFNAPSVRSIISDLAKNLPTLRPHLLSITSRLWDLQIIFKKHLPTFASLDSQSTKRLLSELFPTLSDNSLNLQDNLEAHITWNKLITLDNSPEKETLITALKEYCKQQTLLMIDIFRSLKSNTLSKPRSTQ